MENLGAFISEHGLENYGINEAQSIYWNLSAPQLYEHALRRGEASLANHGPLIVRTGEYTGRSPKDKFIVREPNSEGNIWWGSVNQPIESASFDRLLAKMQAHAADRDLYVFDGYAGADPDHRMPVRVITEFAWHNLFARSMFLEEASGENLIHHQPQFTVIDMPNCFADPEKDGTRSKTFVLVDFHRRMVLIGGTEYAGEIKKSIFTAFNYYLPLQGIMSMHCSANYGTDKADAALFFGLSGTGKTTLSNDPERTLVGDDEHGWDNQGVFNFEGGCYAKVIRLDPEGEPEIYGTTRRFGTILENVVFDENSREVDLDDGAFTENTRAVYPISQLGNIDPSGMCGHPRNIIFLTADAFGVLPPVSRLTRSQAMYHFLSGYTAKVAGTERGVSEPAPVFSAGFGAPFLPLRPEVYAELLGEKVDAHRSAVWLVNTGWIGGPAGVGHRIELAYTRRIISAILSGEIDGISTTTEPHFGLAIPRHVEGIPARLLTPRDAWSDGAAYDAQARQLVAQFVDNFKQFGDELPSEIVLAGPRQRA